jgi:hypothetical protein
MTLASGDCPLTFAARASPGRFQSVLIGAKNLDIFGHVNPGQVSADVYLRVVLDTRGVGLELADAGKGLDSLHVPPRGAL